MSNRLFADLFAADQMARSYGVGLHPKLRDAIEADMRFPAKAASPRPQGPAMLPDTVPRLSDIRKARANPKRDAS